MEKEFFENIKKYVREVVGEKGSHNFSHIERVYKYSILISKDLDVDLDIVKTAALLHDIARPKEERGETKDHAEQGAIDAKEILNKTGFPKEKIEIVCKCILMHNKKKDLPEIKEVRVLKEADGLDAVGAIGISREFSFNGEEYIWDNSPKSSLNILKRNSEADYFILPIAKKIAEEKVKFTKLFCNQFIKEQSITI